MKYTKEQRLDIARRVYDGDLTVEEAAVKYELNPSSVKGYLRLGPMSILWTKKSKDYAAFFSSSSSLYCQVIFLKKSRIFKVYISGE